MEGLVESIEYYYDEDFSIPFDIGISEENNNANLNQGYNFFRCMDINDDEEIDQEDFDNDELDRVIMPEHIFSQIKSLQNVTPFQKTSQLLNMKRSYNNIDAKRRESTQSAVRMSCSSSPTSASSTANNGDVNNRLYFDSFTHNMSFIESTYSLKTRVPLFNQNNKNVLVNYHLHFAPQDSFMTSSIRSYDAKACPKHDQNISPNTNDTTDSGKCSATTVDSVNINNITDDPIRFFQCFSASYNKTLKPDAILWRQIKYIMLYHFSGWSLLRLFKQFRKKSKSVSVTTDEIVTFRLKHGNSKRSKRYSCSVLEMYNSLNDADRRLGIMLGLINPHQLSPSKQSNNFSCQFPPKNRRQNSREQSTPSRNTKQAFDYPGIGKLCMPKQTRLNCSVFLSSDLDSQLSFLQSSLSNQSDTTYNRINDVISPKIKFKDSPKSMCSLDYNNGFDDKSDGTTSLKPCLRKEDEVSEPKEIKLRSASQRLIAATENFKRKSVSFDCPRVSTINLVQEMKEIPKKWGFHGTEAKSSTDMMAIFECGRRDSLLGYTGVHDSSLVNDDNARFREMVNDVLRAIKQIFDRLAVSNTEKGCSKEIAKTFHSQLNELCELISCGDGLDTPLATAIDNLITLLCDGLVVTSFSSKKVRVSNSTNKAAMRLWLLIEETCRLSSNTVRKVELSQLLREVRQMVSCASSNKDHHMRLRAFIANALKTGLMHVWMRSVVANDAALQRFYCPEAFLRQARGVQSDALAALTVSLKTLTSTQPSPNNRPSTQQSPVISKPVLPPPVKISRRFLPSPTSPNIMKLIHKPIYSEETTTESESYADESRSSQSECPPNRDISNNNSIFSRNTHPRMVKKSSTASNLNPTFIDSLKNTPFRKPTKSQSNHSCNVTMTRPTVISIPMKTIRTHPISSKIKSSKPDNLS